MMIVLVNFKVFWKLIMLIFQIIQIQLHYVYQQKCRAFSVETVQAQKHSLVVAAQLQ